MLLWAIIVACGPQISAVPFIANNLEQKDDHELMYCQYFEYCNMQIFPCPEQNSQSIRTILQTENMLLYLVKK